MSVSVNHCTGMSPVVYEFSVPRFTAGSDESIAKALADCLRQAADVLESERVDPGLFGEEFYTSVTLTSSFYEEPSVTAVFA